MGRSEDTRKIRREYDKSCRILGELFFDESGLRQKVSDEITRFKDGLLAAFPLNNQPEQPDDAVFLLFLITPDEIIKIYDKVKREGGS